MPYTLLQNRIASLPKILAGPLVRKVTAESVSIWIAFQSAENNIKLLIHETPDAAATTSNRMGNGATITLGENLHVALITANISSQPLVSGQRYFYNLTFGGGNKLSSTSYIGSDGISQITYGGEALPSFLLPASQVNDLKIVHGSCRKPHGGFSGNYEDALKGLSTLMSQTHHDPALRPQQLYLTGDQIYADDVHNMLLFMLRDAENTLMGWNPREALPDTEGLDPPIHVQLQPLNRKELVKKAKMTTEDGESHLLRLGEFYAMYLFVWCTTLWPENEDGFPSIDDYEVYAFKEFGELPLDDDEKEEMQEKYDKQKAILSRFFKNIPDVRRVLANIASYMIFDDHEVTDDWFLNKKWTTDVLGNNLGKRILQNGLASFAVFQAWGNTPELFADAAKDENKVLVQLSQLKDNPTNNSIWDQIGNLLLPTFNSGTNELTGGLDWHFSISFDQFQAIILNTRTRRALFKNNPGLLGTANNAFEEQISAQLANQSSNSIFTLVISPTPVFGIPIMEDVLQMGIAQFKSAEAADFEAWKIHRKTFQELLDRLVPFGRVILLSGDVHYGFSNEISYWEDRTENRRAKFINLTASSLKNSNDSLKGTTTLASLVNGSIYSTILSEIGFDPTVGKDVFYVGWDQKGDHILAIYDHIGPPPPPPFQTRSNLSVNGFAPFSRRLDIDDVYSEGVSKVIKNHYVRPGHKPQWEYRIRFKMDARLAVERAIGAVPGTGINNHRSAKITRDNHTVIGINNFGLISFENNSERVKHTLWMADNNGQFHPYVQHDLNFEIPTETGRASQRPIPA